MVLGNLLWHIAECVHLGTLLNGTAEKRFQHTGLAVELFQHQLELCTVLGRIVSLTTDKGVATFTDVIDFLCTQFGLLGRAASRQDFLCHEFFGIGQGLGRSALGRFGQQSLLCIRIDTQKQPIAAQAHQGCHGLALQLDGVGLGTVGHTVGFQFHFLQFPFHLLALRHLVEPEITVGILVELARTGDGLLRRYSHTQGGGRKIVAHPLHSGTRYKRFHLCLRHC